MKLRECWAKGRKIKADSQEGRRENGKKSHARQIVFWLFAGKNQKTLWLCLSRCPKDQSSLGKGRASRPQLTHWPLPKD